MLEYAGYNAGIMEICNIMQYTMIYLLVITTNYDNYDMVTMQRKYMVHISP